MDTHELFVSICVCTCRRPQSLRRLLRSLVQLEVPAGCRIELVVVDNDAVAPSRSAFEEVAAAFPWPARYSIEPSAGVSHARNRCVAEAQGNWIAFVDDDEWVEPNWLVRMLETAAKSRADVVIGPVLASFEVDPPEWVKSSRAFDHHRDLTGRQIDWRCCACGNALIRRELFERVGCFDTDFGASGAEDTEFFSRCEAVNATMVWCDEALAYEGVPVTRMSHAWIMQRAKDGGRNYARVVVLRRGAGALPGLLARGLAGAVIFGCIALTLRMAGHSSALYFARKATAGLGKVTPWAVRHAGLYGDAGRTLT